MSAIENDLSKLLKSMVIPGLGGNPAQEGGVSGFLRNGSYAVSSFGEDQSLILDRIRLQDFSDAISFDYERFALSTLETCLVAMVENDSHKSLGWPTLKTYYSGFFAAHSILRSQGLGVLQISAPLARTLSELAGLFLERRIALEAGQYTFALDYQQGEAHVAVILRPLLKGSGVHDVFWREFVHALERQGEALTVRQNANGPALVLEAIDLKNAIVLGGSRGAWLSSIRNEINYQHAYDIWRPYRKSSEAFRCFDSSSPPSLYNSSLLIDKSRAPIKAFLQVCLYISAAAVDIGDYLAIRSTRGGAFGQKWRKLRHSFPTR